MVDGQRSNRVGPLGKVHFAARGGLLRIFAKNTKSTERTEEVL